VPPSAVEPILSFVRLALGRRADSALRATVDAVAHRVDVVGHVVLHRVRVQAKKSDRTMKVPRRKNNNRLSRFSVLMKDSVNIT